MSNEKPHFTRELEGRFDQAFLYNLTGDASKDVLFLLQSLSSLQAELELNRNSFSSLQRKLAEANERIVEFEGIKAGHLKVQDELQKKISELKANLWVAKDSALRTYDGLAQKADKADDLQAELDAAKEEIKRLQEYEFMYKGLEK